MDLAEESLLAELITSRRLDFNKALRNHQARYGLSVKDETEWMEMMQLRGGCKRMKTLRCGTVAIVCQINKLRPLKRNPRAEKV
jgi:hypothetical protein